MPFLDEIDDVRDKVPGGRLPRPVLLGVVLVAVAVLAISAVGVASSARGDFVVENGAIPPSAATSSEGAASSASNAISGDGADPSAAAAQSSASPACYVYVVGAVKEPGVYALPAGSRLDAAIEAAGGFSKHADRSAVNLARTLVDGEQVTVPEEGQASPAGAAGSSTSAAGSGASGAPAGKVNINTASAEELQTLDGIGEATAAKIVASREAEGPFASIEDLTRVSGIGEKKLAAIAGSITV